MDEEKKQNAGELAAQDQHPVTVEDALRACMDATGFVCCVGVQTTQRDERGDPIVKFIYIRRYFSLEDTRKGLRYFEQEFQRDKDAL